MPTPATTGSSPGSAAAALDPATGHYGQGAFNADDIARAAVVYLRHWRQTGSADSRTKAYELLRSVAYLQTDTGANRGRTVLWIQSDGTLNPSATPVELPDPSDSGPSYWQARSLWAFGEGYAAFRKSDPAFAAFLQQRIQLSVGALERDVLARYRHYKVADGRRVPAWLIVNGADATAEAVLGLSAYSRVAPGDTAARRALSRFAEGIADMAAGTRQQWPYRRDPAVHRIALAVARLVLPDGCCPCTGGRNAGPAVAGRAGGRGSAELRPDPAHRRRRGQRLAAGSRGNGADRLRRRFPGAVAARCRRHDRDRRRGNAGRPARLLVLRRQPGRHGDVLTGDRRDLRRAGGRRPDQPQQRGGVHDPWAPHHACARRPSAPARLGNEPARGTRPRWPADGRG